MSISLEKRGDTISLEKKTKAAHGEILVNLNWNKQQANQNVDLDLACLFEFKDGNKGGVQALGNAMGNYQQFPFVQLDSDDRTGASEEGENLRINGSHWDDFKRILIFTFIYEGVPNWSQTNAVVTLTSPGQPEIKVRLDSHDNSRTLCAIALLENNNGAIRVTKDISYFQSHQEMDRKYNWGLNWVPGRK